MNPDPQIQNLGGPENPERSRGEKEDKRPPKSGLQHCLDASLRHEDGDPLWPCGRWIRWHSDRLARWAPHTASSRGALEATARIRPLEPSAPVAVTLPGGNAQRST